MINHVPVRIDPHVYKKMSKHCKKVGVSYMKFVSDAIIKELNEIRENNGK